MPIVTLDRFGRIVIPQALRLRHGWRPGTILDLRDGPDGFEARPVTGQEPASPGWAWQDGMLICTAQAVGNLSDVAAMREAEDAARDRLLSGLP